MAVKTITPEKLRKEQMKREKEIRKWEKEKAKPKRSFYFPYLVFIITLIYTIDEIASQIGTLMKTEIANDLLYDIFGEKSITMLDTFSIPLYAVSALGLLYRPLADRWGRKTFLVINTFGMSAAMFIVFLSNNIVVYLIGAAIIQFFIPHDMHVVYIMESAPDKHRGKIYSSIKFVATISVMLVPLLRRLLMQNASEWRNVFLVPAIVGVIASFVALLTAREPDTFIDARLHYLSLSDKERADQKNLDDAQNKQGGLITALKFAFKHKQLRWLYITSSLVNIGFVGTMNYQSIMSYGFAQQYVDGGLAASIDDVLLDLVGTKCVTPALFLFPVGCAVSQVIMGFVSDYKGRKSAAITTAANCLLAFIGFSLGLKFEWSFYLIGFLCGAFVGSYYSLNDVIIMMVSESSPTTLRSSTMSAQFIVTAAGYVISMCTYLAFAYKLGDQIIGTVAFSLMVPGFISALVALIARTHDTKGVDMDTVTGCEWD